MVAAPAEQTAEATTELLPNRLRSGDVIASPAGCRVRVTRTSALDHYGEPMYKLRFMSFGATAKRQLYSRDELAEMGARLQLA